MIPTASLLADRNISPRSVRPGLGRAVVFAKYFPLFPSAELAQSALPTAPSPTVQVSQDILQDFSSNFRQIWPELYFDESNSTRWSRCEQFLSSLMSDQEINYILLTEKFSCRLAWLGPHCHGVC